MTNLKDKTMVIEIVRDKEHSDTTLKLESELLHGLFKKLEDRQIDDLINRHMGKNKQCIIPAIKELKNSAKVSKVLDPGAGLWTVDSLKELVPEIREFSKTVFKSYLNPVRITNTLTVEESIA